MTLPKTFAAAFVALLLPLHALAAPPPAELTEALATFRTEGTKGWAFTQTTKADGKSLVEQFNPAKPEFQRWTLVQKDGRPPTADEARDYHEKLTRRTSGQTAPNVKDQLDLNTCTLVTDDGTRVTYRFRLKPGGADDKSAQFMASSFTLHRPSRTIERVELASLEPFSPMMTVKIKEARTAMTYSLPEGEMPTLLQQVTMHVRGTAMWFKSLDSEMTVTFADHVYAGKKPTPGTP